jgi:hypothetical protein
MEDSDLSYTINALRSPEARNRISILKVLCRSDRADEQVLPHIEELLNDLTPCMIDVKPICFSEIRFLAGQALKRQRRLLGIEKPVNFSGFIHQIEAGDLLLLAEEMNISSHNFQETFPEVFEKLRDLGKLALCDKEGYPEGFLSSLSY